MALDRCRWKRPIFDSPRPIIGVQLVTELIHGGAEAGLQPGGYKAKMARRSSPLQRQLGRDMLHPELWDCEFLNSCNQVPRVLVSIVVLIVVVFVQKAYDAVDGLGAEVSGGGSDELHGHIRVRNV